MPKILLSYKDSLNININEVGADNLTALHYAGSHIQDQSVVKNLIAPIKEKVKHITADGAYDNNPTYKILTSKFPCSDIVIPPQKGAAENKENEFYRNRNILEIKYYGHMQW